MEFSPAKRRKVALTTSVKSMDEQSPRRRLVSRDDNPSSSRRASFLSPTKTNLARFNPNLLPPSGHQSSAGCHQGNGNVSGDRELGTMAGMVQPGRATSAGPVLPTPTTVLNPDSEGTFSLTLTQETAPSRRARLLATEDTRASPPEEARYREHEGQRMPDIDDNMPLSHENGFSGANSAAVDPHFSSTPANPSAIRIASGMGLGHDGEPSLPSTPIHLGLEKPPEPPRGLHSSSGSKERRRKESMSIRSSPLKSQGSTTSAEAPMAGDLFAPSLGPRLYIGKTPKPPPTVQETSIINMRANLARLEKELLRIEDGLIRQSLMSGWEKLNGQVAPDNPRNRKTVTSKGSRLAHLQQELLQGELAISTIDRREGQETYSHALNHEIIEEAATIDVAHTAPETSSLSRRLASFLPFSERPLPPRLIQSSSPRSDEPWYLNLRSPESGKVPFAVSTSDIKLLRSTPGNPILQHQTVQLSSPYRLLTAKLLITVDITSQTITQSQVEQLSPWAEEELGSWMRTMPHDTALVTLGQAFGNYWIACLDRFRCWNELAHNFSNLLVENGDLSGIPLRADERDQERVQRVLGRPKCVLARDTVGLEFDWVVSLDEHGELDRHVSVCPHFPDTWLGTEVGAELAKVGEAFSMLIKDNGVAQAMFVMANLIFRS